MALEQSLSFLATEVSRPNPLLAGNSADNLVKFDTAYLYRLAPQPLGDTLTGAWYAGEGSSTAAGRATGIWNCCGVPCSCTKPRLGQRSSA